MKRTRLYLYAGLLLPLMASCVSMKEYEALQSQYSQTVKSWNLTKQELQELREENAELVRQGGAMTVALADASAARHECEATVESINRSYASLQLRYDTTVENYMQQITGKNRDLTKARNLLEQRTRELNEKEQTFRQREAQLLAQQQQLQQRQAELEESERIANEALAAKKQELNQLRWSVARALVGFSGKGLAVEVKEGRVHVSMEDKLLFASGSWTVSEQGVEAIGELARVLEEQTDLTILVEGHTDNDAFRGTSLVQDNWDLSVLRATAIVKLLLEKGPAIDPRRVEACGHGEYAPKVPNTDAASKAMNRRTEIILTPRLTDIIDILGQ